MSLVNDDYGSSTTSESESEENSSPPIRGTLKRAALPTATALLGAKQSKHVDEDVQDDPAQHGGRIRSFKHERGNWATHVYVPAPACAEQLEDFQVEAISLLTSVVKLEPCELLHLSLSKTVVILHHQIDEFSKSLHQALLNCSGFRAVLQDLKVYTNDERSRTFLAVQLDGAYMAKISALLRPIDVVMRDYRLPQFYSEPSFHISLLWCVGDHQKLLQDKLKELQQLLNSQDVLHLNVNEIHCKCGNKQFSYRLK